MENRLGVQCIQNAMSIILTLSLEIETTCTNNYKRVIIRTGNLPAHVFKNILKV